MRVAASLILLLAAAPGCCAFRKRHQSKTPREQVDVDAPPGTESDIEGCGSCDALESYLSREAWSWNSAVGASDTAVGTAGGVCCRALSRFTTRPTEMMSASKMVSGYTIMRLIDEGLLSLDTKAADVLDYWTATDGRKDVTVRHLLSQTAGLTTFPLGMGACTDGGVTGNGTRNCARQAYDGCFPDYFTVPGESWEYTETTFYVVSAMALEVTNSQYWDDVFQTYLAGPLGVDPDRCKFSLPNAGMAFAGGGLVCDTLDFGKILQAILGKTLFKNAALYDVAEQPQTINLKRSYWHQRAVQSCTAETRVQGCDEEMMPEWGVGRAPLMRATPGVYWHYALGQYVECADPKCEGGILRTSSRGMMGTYPFIDRGAVSGHAPHWGIIVRLWPITGQGIKQIQEEVLPLVAAIVD